MDDYEKQWAYKVVDSVDAAVEIIRAMLCLTEKVMVDQVSDLLTTAANETADATGNDPLYLDDNDNVLARRDELHQSMRQIEDALYDLKDVLHSASNEINTLIDVSMDADLPHKVASAYQDALARDIEGMRLDGRKADEILAVVERTLTRNLWEDADELRGVLETHGAVAMGMA